MYSLQKVLFQSIFNQLTDPAIIVMADAPVYTIVASNHKYDELSDSSGGPLIGKQIKDIYAYLKAGQHHYALLIAGLAQAFSTSETVNLPVFGYDQAGPVTSSVFEALWQIEIRVLPDEAGKLNYLLLVIHPVTLDQKFTATLSPALRSPESTCCLQTLKEENRQLTLRNIELEKQLYSRTTGFLVAQAASESERDRVNRLFMQAPASIAVLGGADLVVELVNPHFQQLFSGIVLTGRPAAEAVPGITLTPVWQILLDVYATGTTFVGKELPHPLSAPQGGLAENAWFNFIYQARRNHLNKIDGILIFAFDVTATVIARRKLEESERQASLIMNAIPQITWTNTAAGNLDFINQRWQDYTGMDLEQTLATGWINTVHMEDQPLAIERFGAILSGTVAGEFELRKRRKDGLYFWHLTRLEPILGPEGQVLFWTGSSTNIDELKRLQKQREEFIDIASHELKTPLTSLKVSMQLLNERRESLSPLLYFNLFERATKSLDKVISLVENLLNVGKFSHGQLQLDKTCFVVGEFIAEIISDLQFPPTYSIAITGDCRQAVCADAKRIEQVVANFLNNAIKYAPGSTRITVHIETLAEEVKISVTDTGPGIAAALLPHLFGRYYRVENQGYNNAGLGLGLYICAEIIEKHGGRLNVESVEGQGSTFWFTLPLAGCLKASGEQSRVFNPKSWGSRFVTT